MSIFLITISIVVVVSLTASYVFSSVLLYSVRQPIVKTPKEYGLDYEDVGFKSADGIDLKGWFIPGKRAASGNGQDRVIILTHPMTFNRHGFLAKNQGLLPLFKTDVDLLTTAAALNQAGYSVLMFDFRDHGESGVGMSGVGLNEYQDISSTSSVNGEVGML